MLIPLRDLKTCLRLHPLEAGHLIERVKSPRNKLSPAPAECRSGDAASRRGYFFGPFAVFDVSTEWITPAKIYGAARVSWVIKDLLF